MFFRRSRYDVNCPVCGLSFRPGRDSTGAPTFPCPRCGERLEFAPRYDALVLFVSTAIGVLFALAIGSQGVAFAFFAIGSACAALFAIVGVMYHIRPPKVQQSLGKGGGGLRLT